MIKKPYAKHDRVAAPIGGPSMTKQSFKEACDVNNILAKAKKTGLVSHVATHQGTYEDLVDRPVDYHEAMNQVIAAQEMFLTLPALVRKRFGHDPGEFLEFMMDEQNEAEARELGLLPAERPGMTAVDAARKARSSAEGGGSVEGTEGTEGAEATP